MADDVKPESVTENGSQKDGGWLYKSMKFVKGLEKTAYSIVNGFLPGVGTVAEIKSETIETPFMLKIAQIEAGMLGKLGINTDGIKRDIELLRDENNKDPSNLFGEKGDVKGAVEAGTKMAGSIKKGPDPEAMKRVPNEVARETRKLLMEHGASQEVADFVGNKVAGYAKAKMDPSKPPQIDKH